jgi:hypothetical protein
MKEQDDLLSNCFLTWTSVLEEKELGKNKIEIGQDSEKK